MTDTKAKQLADVGLNSAIELGQRKFHIQTSTALEEGKIIAEVFEQGRLLFHEVYPYERRRRSDDKLLEKRVKTVLENFHAAILEELEALFHISRRLESVTDRLAHERLGYVFLNLHVFDKAEHHLRRALELDPHHYSSSIYLARCYYSQKKYQKAISVLNQYLKENIPYADFYHMLGLVMVERNKFLAALQHFKKAIQLNPHYVEAHINIARTLLRRIQLLKLQEQEADIEKNINFLKATLKKILTLNPDSEAEFVKKVFQYLKKNQLNQAEAFVTDYWEKHYVRRQPPELIAHLFYLFLKYYEEEMSLELLERFADRMQNALEKNPGYPDLWNYYGLLNIMLCRYYFFEGKQDIQRALEINPGFIKAKSNYRVLENDSREFSLLIQKIV